MSVRGGLDASRPQGHHRRRLRTGLHGAGPPHRTGHGIGLDIHEWTNFVRGNNTPLQPGMCFSDEPMIAIYGEFGIRLEDCLYITESGAKFFTQPSEAIGSAVCGLAQGWMAERLGHVSSWACFCVRATRSRPIMRSPWQKGCTGSKRSETTNRLAWSGGWLRGRFTTHPG